MPLTVITLKNSPPSLRGDLSKWMQEIATGVYIGNFNTKVREQLWNRVIESVGVGEATLSYAFRNEIGYDFKTHNTMKKTVNFDGIPLVLSIIKEEQNEIESKKGFSKASKYRKAKKYMSVPSKTTTKDYVVIDIETDGIDYVKNCIIEIGAVKITSSTTETFNRLIKIDKAVPEEIIKLTGITDEILKREGVNISQGLEDLLKFIDGLPIVGYNVEFDIKFINKELLQLNKSKLINKHYDLMNYIKRENMFLKDYKLQSVLKEYGISEKVPHRALKDAMLTYELITKVNEFLEKIK